jgi:hypothetical protein
MSALLSIAIICSIIAGVLFWGIPYIDRMKTEATVQTVLKHMNTAADSLEDLIQEPSGSARQYDVLIHDGVISAESTGDRFIIMYSFVTGYDFTVSGFDEEPETEFTVQIDHIDSVDLVAKAYFITEEPSETEPQEVPPGPSPILSSSNVIFDWTPSIPQYTLFSYQLENYNPYWSSWTTLRSTTYYNLPDNSYIFNVKEKDGSGNINPINVKDIAFEVVEGNREDSPISLSISGSGPYTLTSDDDYPLVNTVRIDLFDGSTLFGRVFLFDLGFIECRFPSTVGTFIVAMENNGILSGENSRETVKREPLISWDLNEMLLNIHIVQVRNTGTSIGGNTFGTVTMSFAIQENYAREFAISSLGGNLGVYYCKIQVFGPYETAWLTYFTRTFKFTESSEENTLLCPQGDTPISFSLAQSLCTIGLK